MKPDLSERFLAYIGSKGLFTGDDPLVVGFSGGPDSMALVDLLARAGQPVVLAHCNFTLRGKESDEDEAFVRMVALVYDLPLQVRRFDTADTARISGISLEMAARDLRYRWLEEVRMETGSAFIAIGHHADDSVETMLINLVRGTGLKGLCGILPANGKVVRPLLFASRKEILDYLAFRKLEYRTDSSNIDIRFVRNHIRQVILPELEQINPGIRGKLKEEQAIFLETRDLLENIIGQARKRYVTEEAERTVITTEGLKNEPGIGILFFEMLRPFGFNGDQCRQVLVALDGRPGTEFLSATHRLLINRGEIIIHPSGTAPHEKHYLDPHTDYGDLPLDINTRLVPNENYRPWNDRNVACLDYEKLDFPLILRRWQPGDFFYPLGMNHPKKLSDFFIDRKISRYDKENAWILASGEQVVWVVGHRIDHRFRVTDETARVLEIRLGF